MNEPYPSLTRTLALQSGNVAKFKLEHNGTTWRGVRVGGDCSQIHLENATAREPFRTPSRFVGCYAQELEAKTEVVVRSVADGKSALSAG